MSDKPPIILAPLDPEEVQKTEYQIMDLTIRLGQAMLTEMNNCPSAIGVTALSFALADFVCGNAAPGMELPALDRIYNTAKEDIELYLARTNGNPSA